MGQVGIRYLTAPFVQAKIGVQLELIPLIRSQSVGLCGR